MSSGLLTTEQVLAAGQKLLELRPLEEVFAAILETAAEAMHAETAVVILGSGQRLELAAAYSRRGDVRGVEDVSQSLVREVIAENKPILTESAVEDPRFSGKSSIILQHIQSAVILPLTGRKAVEGALYLDSRSDRDLFRKENLAPLATLAAFATLAIENARRFERAQSEIAALKSRDSKTLIVGDSPAIRELYSLIDRVAASDLPVIITGESGTGKELVAREVHRTSPRASKPFLALYCGNVSPELFESELFGHKRGSFTGAVSDKEGLVEAAEGGTLFLDEVADIPAALQAKLLRFLQESEYRRVGDTELRKANVRILTATNKNLQAEIQSGNLREDLYYRLYILPVTVPPLRERLADIPFLVHHFLRKLGNHVSGISPEALRRLQSYTWPGNVRELENTIVRAAVITRSDRIEAEDISHQAIAKTSSDEDWSWKAAEKLHILQVLSLCGGNRSRAAQMLGISRRYLHYKLKEWGEQETQ
ncbi:MAG: sigma-54-dependent Fis family transcriptional regulator [Calditrichaeota bacterium]|nr:sigma-54-dependent Fis family transcriptional regulator [Calditrichota bacterium]MCB9391433.1 sigma-54-dependent Fis family transcriptional regulator [Calditrichota bacterium]